MSQPVLRSELGVPGGVATLGSDGKIFPAQLPQTSSGGSGVVVAQAGVAVGTFSQLDFAHMTVTDAGGGRARIDGGAVQGGAGPWSGGYQIDERFCGLRWTGTGWTFSDQHQPMTLEWEMSSGGVFTLAKRDMNQLFNIVADSLVTFNLPMNLMETSGGGQLDQSYRHPDFGVRAFLRPVFHFRVRSDVGVRFVALDGSKLYLPDWQVAAGGHSVTEKHQYAEVEFSGAENVNSRITLSSAGIQHFIDAGAQISRIVP